MRILLLCWRDTTHPQGGGSERYLEHVGRYLAEHGHEVIYRTAKTPAGARSFRHGIQFQRVGGRFSVYPRADIALLAGSCGFGPLKGVDVVVDTQNGIPFFARLFSSAAVVVLTHHCHRQQWPVAGWGLAQLGWFLESRVSPLVHRRTQWVTVSDSSQQELVGLKVDPSRIAVIRNGVDPVAEGDVFSSVSSGSSIVGSCGDNEYERDCVGDVCAALERGSSAARQYRLVTLSRLVPHKNIEHAMQVLGELSTELDVVLDVVGSGWWEDKLRVYARRNGVADRVVFHGQVDEAYKHEILARADVHLMPSVKEGWGLAVIEAAQHGVATVGYRFSGGLTDSVIDGVTGVLVDDCPSLVDATRMLLLDDVLRQKLGTAAKLRAGEFSWETTGKQFADLIERVVGQTRQQHNVGKSYCKRSVSLFFSPIGEIATRVRGML